MSILCSMVGASFVSAVAEVIRAKKGITAIGNAQVDTAQSKFGGAAALFDGTGDYLEIFNASPIGTGEFTIDYWVRAVSTASTPTLVDLRFGTGDTTGYSDYINSSGKLVVFMNSGNRITSTTTINTNTWYHIAIVRDSSSNIKLYINGTNEGSAYNFSNNMTSSYYRIGNNVTAANGLNGHIDEVRISNTARYTSNFTAPTAPFVNDANTLLLLHCDGTDAVTFFEDDNGIRSKRGIIALGNAQVDTAQSKFDGAAALFDGTGDYLSTSAITWHGASAGTIEFWFRLNSTVPFAQGLISQCTQSSANGFQILTVSNQLYWYENITGQLIWNSTLTTGVWYHIAVVKESSSTVKIYVDGTLRFTDSTSSGFTDSTNDFWIGRGYGISSGQFDATRYELNGWIDELRISNTARYTSNFTPSTTAFVNDANTLLLLHMNGTDASTVFTDDNGVRAQKGITAIGNAQVDTAQSKFSGASALFDGTGDYLIVGNTVDNDLALTGTTWTVEYWARINAHAGQFQATVGIWDSVGSTGSVWYVSTNMFNTTNRMGIEYIHGTNSGSGAISFGSSLSTGVWQHHAYVRNGNTLTAYLDGVSQGTHDMTGRTIDITGFNSSSNTSLKMTIGAMTGGSGAYNGWLDEIRISNIARYTTGFTPSTIPFVNDANTVLLIHCDGTDAVTVFTDDNGVPPNHAY
jgi:hypothetical protein